MPYVAPFVVNIKDAEDAVVWSSLFDDEATAELFVDQYDADEKNAFPMLHAIVCGFNKASLPPGCTTEIVSADESVDPNWIALRAERDRLLALCDYTQLGDAPFSSEEKEAWATYRQALRDLPQNTEDPTQPVWPTEPS